MKVTLRALSKASGVREETIRMVARELAQMLTSPEWER